MMQTKPFLSILPNVIVLSTILFMGCKEENTKNYEKKMESSGSTLVPTTLSYVVTNIYPHDTACYTEGLEWQDSILLESGGDYGDNGHSKLSKVSLKDGKDIQKLSFPSKDFFGEGITLFNGKIYQLTYKTGKCNVYEYQTLKKINEFSYDGEGWGMTNDGKNLIMNNGGDKLIYRDPNTFKIMNLVSVSDNNGPLSSINEMEYVDGFIYANIFTYNRIVKIDPNTGKVVAQIDFTGLLEKYAPGQLSQTAENNGAVLNGIAYNKANKRFYITGKLWPKLFEVQIQ